MLRQLETHHEPAQGRGLGEQRLRLQPFAESRTGEDPVFGGRYGQSREEGQQMNQQFNQGQQFADADLARELTEVTRTANRANATLYTIDPRGLVAGADLDQQLDPVEYGTTSARRRTACASWPKRPAASPSSTRTISPRR